MRSIVWLPVSLVKPKSLLVVQRKVSYNKWLVHYVINHWNLRSTKYCCSVRNSQRSGKLCYEHKPKISFLGIINLIRILSSAIMFIPLGIMNFISNNDATCRRTQGLIAILMTEGVL
jgi:hypothetical protein